ncbi:MAG: hypothetical protein R3185_08435 [Candidatus Thermoplasmatota archaeon]|nr:hypothetical protein [Candidatus Thermoplasmatota archaeon]
MKLDIGRGKILGTKRVSPNGQISGFTEYAGQEVLVVLPEGDTEAKPDARDLVEEIKAATQQQMRIAFREYEDLKERFSGPGEATRHFLETNTPRSFQGLYDRIEAWASTQTSQAEDRVRRALEPDEAAQAPDAGSSTSPDPIPQPPTTQEETT